jgi:hypothetical protein
MSQVRGTASARPRTLEKLNKKINAALADPKFKAHLADLGGTPLSGSPADFSSFRMKPKSGARW